VSHLPDNAGICASCIHARSVTSNRGSVFLLCELSFSDARFQKYPKLPVRSCSGYKEKLANVPTFDWTAGALAEGLRCYQAGRFFEAHEHWEAVWLEAAEPDKTFLQGLIQVTAAFHHWRQGNQEGTASLLRQGLQKLERFEDGAGQAMVAPLRAEIRKWLEGIAAAETSELRFPEIRVRNEA
jgi:predicted metal-dependent hydrolase